MLYRITDGSLTVTTSDPQLADLYAPGLYWVALDLNALQSGDQFTLRVRHKVRAADTERVLSTIDLTYPFVDLSPMFGPFLISETGQITVDKDAGTDRAVPYRVHRQGGRIGKVVSDGGNGAGTFKTNFGEGETDHFKEGWLRFVISTNLRDQVRRVSAYNGSTKFVTLASAFSQAPATDDVFELVV